MFADPQSLTINGVAVSLPRIMQEGLSATYANSDETITMKISHQVTKANRVRTVVAVMQRKVVTDPLSSNVDDWDDYTVSKVFDRPLYGFSLAEVQYLTAALDAWEDNTVVAKLHGKES